MRLQAEITTDVISKIASLLKSYTKEDIILYFSEKNISFCISMNNQIGAWIECDIPSCFNKYLIKSKQDDTISLKVEVSQLAQALAYDQSYSIRAILSQKDSSVFLQLIHRTLDGLKQLEQRVPIILLNQQSVLNYAEPDWGKATMVAKLPQIKNLTDWCSKLQGSTFKYLTISIIRNSDSGKIDVGLRAESESKTVSVYTRFPDMEITNSFKDRNNTSESEKNGISEQIIDSNNDITDEEVEDNDLVECDVTIELKKFAKTLKVQQLQPTVQRLYIHDKKLLRLQFETLNSKMTVALFGLST